ncbi:MAG: type II toxin-antitoxin system VapC family toxin [Candidatus Bathyarchaeia archaeon]
MDAYAFGLYPLRGGYAAEAIRVSFENDITIYNSSYVSLAAREGAEMYTGDRDLIKRLREPYLRFVKDLREAGI